MKRGKQKIWILVLILGISIVLILSSSKDKDKEKDKNKDSKNDTKVELNEEIEVEEETFRISKLEDIPQNVIDKALTYTNDDLEARMNDLDVWGDGLSNIVEKASSFKNEDKEIYNYLCNGIPDTSVRNNSFKLKEIIMLLPKDGSKIGYLDFVYEIDLDVSFHVDVYNKDYAYKGTIYTNYSYEINLENEDLIIGDYNDYHHGSINEMDIDYENFYNKVFVAKKGEYQIVKKGE